MVDMVHKMRQKELEKAIAIINSMVDNEHSFTYTISILSDAKIENIMAKVKQDDIGPDWKTVGKVKWIKWFRGETGCELRMAIDYGNKHIWPETIS